MLTLQLFVDNQWHDIAFLDVKEPRKGRGSAAALAF